MIRWELTTAVTSGYDENGFIGIQPAAFGQNNGADSGMGHHQMVQPLGYYARPLDRDTTGVGCWTLAAIEGGKGYAWCIQDPRYAKKAPPLSKGSRAWVADSGTFVLLDYDYGEIHYVPDGSSAHAFTIGKNRSGASVINLQHSSGAFALLTNDSAQLRGPGSPYVEVKSDAINLNGASKVIGSLGVGGEAGIVPVGLATPLISYLTAAEALWGTIAAATVPSTAAAVTAFLAATSALKAAIASQYLTAA